MRKQQRSDAPVPSDEAYGGDKKLAALEKITG
jgi:hypothetical protein